MNITSIQVLGKVDNVRRVFRLHRGAGKFANILVIDGEKDELDLVANALMFAFRSQRSKDVDEVTVEITDNSGETWTIHRGSFGSRFLKAGRSIGIDEAQRSMLASWFDMEVGLSTNEGLVTTITNQWVQCKSGRFAIGDYSENSEVAKNRDLDPEIVIKMLAEECAKIVGLPAYSDASKIAKLSESLADIRGRMQEVLTVPEGKTLEHAPSVVMLEGLYKELDLLQQIDFLCRRMGDAEESIPRLNGQLEGIESRLNELNQKWSHQALMLGQNIETWKSGLSILVKMKGYERLSETAVRIKRLVQEKVKPLAEQAFSAWDDFLLGSKSTGQDVESCLASTLLGLKHLSLELEKVVYSQESEVSSSSEELGASWLEKLRGAKKKSDSTYKTEFKLDHQKSWMARSTSELESIKESVGFTLTTVQKFVDELTKSKQMSRVGLTQIEDVARKTEEELSKLKANWTEWTAGLEVLNSLSIESLCDLVIESTEVEILAVRRKELSDRLTERMANQNSLADLVRQWWSIIGSDRSVDISNPAFLVAEARAALRYRETRRQRVHKALKESARASKDEAIRHYSHRRKSELMSEWRQAFEQNGLPPLDLLDQSLDGLIRIGSAINAMNQLLIIRDEAKFAGSSTIFSAGQSPLRMYRWYIGSETSENQKVFEQMLISQVQESSQSISLFLINDSSAVSGLSKLGCGYAVSIASPGGVKSLQKPGAEAAPSAVRKSSPTPKVGLEMGEAPSNSKTGSQEVGRKQKGQMSQRAAHVLQILNPKEKIP